MEKWNDNIKNNNKIKILWRQGIPWNIRGSVWLKAIGNKLQISEQLFKIFQEHVKDNKKTLELNKETENETLRMIALDLPRTWAGLQFFSNTGPFYEQLSTVLQCYAMLRPDVGYVQGMGYLAGMLLLYMDTYEAFVCLANLLNNHFFLSLFKIEIEEVNKIILY
jgi:hypothetical protein